MAAPVKLKRCTVIIRQSIVSLYYLQYTNNIMYIPGQIFRVLFRRTQSWSHRGKIGLICNKE